VAVRAPLSLGTITKSEPEKPRPPPPPDWHCGSGGQPIRCRPRAGFAGSAPASRLGRRSSVARDRCYRRSSKATTPKAMSYALAIPGEASAPPPTAAGACFWAIAIAPPWEAGRMPSWRCGRPTLAIGAIKASRLQSSAVRRGRERMRSRKGAPSALRESSLTDACHVMGAERD